MYRVSKYTGRAQQQQAPNLAEIHTNVSALTSTVTTRGNCAGSKPQLVPPHAPSATDAATRFCMNMASTSPRPVSISQLIHHKHIKTNSPHTTAPPRVPHSPTAPRTCDASSLTPARSSAARSWYAFVDALVTHSTRRVTRRHARPHQRHRNSAHARRARQIAHGAANLESHDHEPCPR